MVFLSIYKRNSDPYAAPAVVDAADDAPQARTRARRRLIGAVVLLVIGVIGFPLVFETRPRPVPVDIPIEIPRQDSVPPLAMPPARPVAAAPAPTAGTAPSASTNDVITESRADAGREVSGRASDAVVSGAASRPAARPAATPAVEAARKPASATDGGATAKATAPSSATAPKPATAPVVAAASRPATAAKPATAPVVAEASRPKATADVKPTPETKPPSPAEAGRFVVQVGAFSEAESARETRQKAEKLGLKTYTQVAQTPAGSRIRVRIGPFANRAEADAALSKARAAGLTAVVLTL
jgi:DedD protein